jgi:hypothetical protein
MRARLLAMALLMALPVTALADGPTAVHLVRILWLLTSDVTAEDAQSALDQAVAFSSHERNCRDIDQVLSDGARFHDLGWVRMNDMPSDVRDSVKNQPIGLPTRAARDDSGVVVYVVCGRK